MSNWKAVIETASSIKPECIEWLWLGYVPLGKLTIFSGNPDVGKSLTSVDIAARMTLGIDWPDGTRNTTPPSDVLMLVSEDAPADTVIPRLMAAGADLNRVHFLTSVMLDIPEEKPEERSFALDTDISILRELLAERPEIRLLIVDPVSSHLGGVDMHKDQDLRRVLTPLSLFAADTGCAVIGIAHFNKTTGVAGIHKTGGSIALTAVPRMVWGFSKSPDDPNLRLMVRIKGNITKEKDGLQYYTAEVLVPIAGKDSAQPVIRWAGRTAETMDSVLAVNADPEQGKMRRAQTWLREFLPADGSRVKARLVYEAGAKQGINESTLRTASNRLSITKNNDDGPWTWALPVESGGAKKPNAIVDDPLPRCPKCGSAALYRTPDGSECLTCAKEGEE